MSILDHFSNYDNMVSLSFLNSPRNTKNVGSLTAPTSPKGQPQRHQSLLHRNLDNRKQQEQPGTRSIEKLFTSKFSSGSHKDQKEMRLHRLTRKLANKVRKLSFQFWVNLEARVKEVEARGKGEESLQKMILADKTEALKNGLCKLQTFFNTSEIKYCQSLGMQRSFQAIKEHSVHRLVGNQLIISVGCAIQRKERNFLKKISQIMSNQLKLQMFVNSLEINMLRGVMGECFCAISSASIKQPTKTDNLTDSRTDSTIDMLPVVSTAISFNKIRIKNHKTTKIKTSLSKESICSLGRKWMREQIPKMAIKANVQPHIENYPEQNDNNILFFDNNSATQKTEPQMTNREKFRHSYSIKERQNEEQVPNPEEKQRKSFQRCSWKELGAENIQSYTKAMPKNKGGFGRKSVSSVFALNEDKIEKIEKKIYGDIFGYREEKNRERNNWRNDRNTLKQIMASLKNTPPKRDQYHQSSCYEEDSLKNYLIPQEDNNLFLAKSKPRQTKVDVDEILRRQRKTDLVDLQKNTKSKRLSITSILPGKPAQKDQKLVISLKNHKPCNSELHFLSTFE